jgi:hypothetical protein
MEKSRNLSSKELEDLYKKLPWFTKDGIDFSKYPLEHPARDITSGDPEKFRSACSIIVSMAERKRQDAIIFIYGLFEYFKNDIKKLEVIANQLGYIENVEFINFLFKQIKETKSTNSNRVYINLLIEKLCSYRPKLVIAGFEELLHHEGFTYRMKEKFVEIIYRLKRN